jgi:hypothetical protein
MTPLGCAVVYVPVLVPVPAAGNTHWLIPRPPPYPRQSRERWSPQTSVPVRDLKAVRDMLNAAKHMIAERRARELRELLRQLEDG